MKLNKNPFQRIKTGEKKIEIRLCDEKRQKVRVGDTITFSLLPDLEEKISVRVIGLLRYATFRDLVADIPLSLFGYPLDYNKGVFVRSIYDIYSKEKEEKFGVLGIRIEKI